MSWLEQHVEGSSNRHAEQANLPDVNAWEAQLLMIHGSQAPPITSPSSSLPAVESPSQNNPQATRVVSSPSPVPPMYADSHDFALQPGLNGGDDAAGAEYSEANMDHG